MAASSRPTGEVTFLFTDIEGSTKLVERLGTAAWRPILERHRELIRAAVEAAGGVEIKHEGDGFFIVFTSPAKAIEAAVAAQRALSAASWPEGVPVRVRMGVHSGVGELDADDDYVGHDVHRAARIAAAGSGGQVLVSESTAALVEGRLPAGVTLKALGAHRLKDLRPEYLAGAVRAAAAGETLLAGSVTRRLVERFVRRPQPDRRPELDELTAREREVLELIARGLTNTEIGAALYLSEATVKTHVTHVLRKLGLRDRVQAVIFAYEAGLVEPGGDGDVAEGGRAERPSDPVSP